MLSLVEHEKSFITSGQALNSEKQGPLFRYFLPAEWPALRFCKHIGSCLSLNGNTNLVALWYNIPYMCVMGSPQGYNSSEIDPKAFWHIDIDILT